MTGRLQKIRAGPAAATRRYRMATMWIIASAATCIIRTAHIATIMGRWKPLDAYPRRTGLSSILQIGTRMRRRALLGIGCPEEGVRCRE